MHAGKEAVGDSLELRLDLDDGPESRLVAARVL